MIARYYTGKGDALTVCHYKRGNYVGLSDSVDGADKMCADSIRMTWGIVGDVRLVDIVRAGQALPTVDLPPVRVSAAQLRDIYTKATR